MYILFTHSFMSGFSICHLNLGKCLKVINFYCFDQTIFFVNVGNGFYTWFSTFPYIAFIALSLLRKTLLFLQSVSLKNHFKLCLFFFYTTDTQNQIDLTNHSFWQMAQYHHCLPPTPFKTLILVTFNVPSLPPAFSLPRSHIQRFSLNQFGVEPGSHYF